MKSLDKLIQLYDNDPDAEHLRFGQWFYCNYCTTGSWPELFYAKRGQAENIIEKWLTDNCYVDKLPRRVK